MNFMRKVSTARILFGQEVGRTCIYTLKALPREVLKASKGSAKEFKRSSILLAKFMAVWLCAVEEEVTHRVRLGLMKSER
jgi:hypothetical protein